MKLSGYVGKELTVTEKGKEHTGVCTSTRTVSKGDQVFLKIPRQAGRYFFVSDLKAPAPLRKAPRFVGSKEKKLGSE